MRDDCRKVAEVGKNISAALHDYHADCFRISNGGANCSLKLLLGGAWDELLSTQAYACVSVSVCVCACAFDACIILVVCMCACVYAMSTCTDSPRPMGEGSRV